MMTNMERQLKPAAGRPRSKTAQRAIFDAALKLAVERGYHEVSLFDIAQTAGVGRQTIYRWWPSKRWLYMDVIFDQFDQAAQTAPPAVVDLETYIKTLVRIAREKTGPITAALLLEAQYDQAFSVQFKKYFWKRREMFRAAIEHAVQPDHELNISVDLLLDMLIGVWWYRILYQFAPLDESLARDMVDAVEKLQVEKHRISKTRS